MITYDPQTPISERTICMKLNKIAGKLNMSLDRQHTGLLTTHWIREMFVTLGATETLTGS
jgi:hypothetical protein